MLDDMKFKDHPVYGFARNGLCQHNAEFFTQLAADRDVDEAIAVQSALLVAWASSMAIPLEGPKKYSPELEDAMNILDRVHDRAKREMAEHWSKMMEQLAQTERDITEAKVQ